MGGGKRSGGAKASMKAAVQFNRKIVACKGCNREEPHISVCRIRKLNFAVFGQKCPREKQLQKKARKHGTQKVRARSSRKRARKKKKD